MIDNNIYTYTYTLKQFNEFGLYIYIYVGKTLIGCRVPMGKFMKKRKVPTYPLTATHPPGSFNFLTIP